MTVTLRDAAKVRFYDSVGECIRERRVAAGMTQAALGRLVGTTGTTLGNIEQGHSVCPLYLVACIAHELDCTIDDLAPVQIKEREAAE